MSIAMLLQAWADTLVTTAALVLLVLLIRKPFARHFGPRLAYTLWLVPALRLALPPLPFGDAVVVDTVATLQPSGGAYLIPVDAMAAAPAAAPLWTFADLLPILFAVWAVGVLTVLVAAMLSHRRFLRTVLGEAVKLEPIGNIRLVMTDAVDGPVAFGLLRRYVAVPHDFFARYVADERALAIDHELAHHRHGDLWANAAALLLLAAQWFNPFAWRAIRAFRFDQEAACDARVLTMADTGPREVRTARYATAIAKSAMGSRLSLAAPMAVHDNLQERLTMLMQQDVSKQRGLVGRLLVGSATLAVLATTATLVPAGIANASVEAGDLIVPPEPPAPPAPPEAPVPPEPVEGVDHVMHFTSHGAGEAVAANGETHRQLTRTVVRTEVDDDDTAPAKRQVDIRVPGNLSRAEILATLREQGVTGDRANMIADRLDAKHKERFRVVIPPVPPVPPVRVPPVRVSAWEKFGEKVTAVASCGAGKKSLPIVNVEDRNGKKYSRVTVAGCSDAAGISVAQIAALKETRDDFVDGDGSRGLSAEIRSQVVAELNRAIADMERASR